MATCTEKTLVIGNRSYKVKWNDEHKIHKLICFVLDRNAEETIIYEHNITRTVEYGTESDEDETETVEDGTESDKEITIYGLNHKDKVLIMGPEQLGSNNVINLEYEPNDIMNIPVNKKELTVQQNIQLNCQLVFAFKDPKDGIPGNVYLQIIKHVKPNSIYMAITHNESNKIVCFKSIASRTKLSVSIIKLEELPDMGYQVKDTSEEITFITHNSKKDVQDLLQMANDYTDDMTDSQNISPNGGYGRSVEVQYLFRCKPTGYMDEVFESEIMRKCMKDNNGDPASSINNKIKGVFFTVTPQIDGTLPNRSFFGDFRILIKPQDIIYGLKWSFLSRMRYYTNLLNLYFADFYCLCPKKNYLPRKTHYVTLVLTLNYSSEDDYCKNHLVQLDWKNNRFLKYVKTTDSYLTSNAFYFNVEVLFTEDLDLHKIPFIKGAVTSWGQGHSTPDGIPKNPNCRKCNLPFH